ncbi:MAG: LPS export ABC transporter periplasmic protein LptC [Opitutales bacterium]
MKPSTLRRLLLAAALGAAGGAAAQTSTQVSANSPIVNFRLPTFTPDGHRQWLIRGSEAVLRNPNEIDVRELALTIFTGDATDRIDTMILSPVAQVAPEDETAKGSEAIRIINDNFEASGIGWTYSHREKRVSIAKHVRVVLHSELKDLLQ